MRANQRRLADLTAGTRIAPAARLHPRFLFSAFKFVMVSWPAWFSAPSGGSVFSDCFFSSAALDANVFDGFGSVSLITTLQ